MKTVFKIIYSKKNKNKTLKYGTIVFLNDMNECLQASPCYPRRAKLPVKPSLFRFMNLKSGKRCCYERGGGSKQREEDSWITQISTNMV